MPECLLRSPMDLQPAQAGGIVGPQTQHARRHGDEPVQVERAQTAGFDLGQHARMVGGDGVAQLARQNARAHAERGHRRQQPLLLGVEIELPRNRRRPHRRRPKLFHITRRPAYPQQLGQPIGMCRRRPHSLPPAPFRHQERHRLSSLEGLAATVFALLR